MNIYIYLYIDKYICIVDLFYYFKRVGTPSGGSTTDSDLIKLNHILLY